MVVNSVKERRKHLGMTQAELSDKSGINKRTICNVENGRFVDVRISTAAKIAAALKVQAWWKLFKYQGDGND